MFIEGFFNLLKFYPEKIFGKKHFLVRFSLIYVSLVRTTYLTFWNTAFKDLFALANNEDDWMIDVIVIVYCLTFFCEDVITRSDDERWELSNKIKN